MCCDCVMLRGATCRSEACDLRFAKSVPNASINRNKRFDRANNHGVLFKIFRSLANRDAWYEVGNDTQLQVAKTAKKTYFPISFSHDFFLYF